MTVSMRVMSAGAGYRYLLKSVAVADADRSLSDPLSGYYTTQGTPPGRWLGEGVADLGDGWIVKGDVVTEEQLRLLLGEGRDPVTGVPLGRAQPQFKPGVQRRAVAGFDVTFSAPKSVSVLWALGDEDTRAAVLAAHHGAINDVIGLMEREVAATRAGANTKDGAVAQVAVTGLVATGFDHWDSRAGDPQLHTHVVIANRVKTVFDGKWRSLDGRPLHAAMVAMSAHYNAVLADRLTTTLGVDWTHRDRGADRNSGWEINGIPEDLLQAFSSRSRDIAVEKDRLIAQYRAEHGHAPSVTTIVKLRAQATLETRPDKTMNSLQDLQKGWQRRARALLDVDPVAWVSGLLGRATRQPSQADLAEESVRRFADRVLVVVGERRATWRRWNLHAEASRQTIGVRFATTAAREQILDRIVHTAESLSVRLTPPELAASPPAFQRPDGTSVFRPAHSAIFTSTELLAAEDRLLESGRATDGPVVPVRNLQTAARLSTSNGVALGEDQAAALITVGTCGRHVDVLVGPAGAGKTTAMRALRQAWEISHGPGSVVGLAPSAAAAQVLADDLGIETANTAKWLYDHHHGQADFRPGQLVIIDEASLAATTTLDAIAAHAKAAGAKVLLVGDYAQLGAVGAGGAFGLLVRDRTDSAELTGIHRFSNPWEKHATLQLRDGHTESITAYTGHDRIRSGTTEAMLDRLFAAWKADRDDGQRSVMVAGTTDTVAALNLRARTDAIHTGAVDPSMAVELHTGNQASPGDVIVTRRNDRRLQAGGRWVKNGDRWTLDAIHPDGTVTITPIGSRSRPVTLPTSYVAAHVELGYAVTAHRAQGATVDSSHVMVRPAMTREALYVAMTRGRHANTAYVTTDQPDTEPHHQPHPSTTPETILAGVLGHVGAEQSAHDAIRSEQDRWTSIDQLAAEYNTIAAAAQTDRWQHLIRTSTLTTEQAKAVINSDAYGPLCAQLRSADATGHDPTRLLDNAIASRNLNDVDDIAAVLHHRVQTATNRAAPACDAPDGLIVGLIPRATGPMPKPMAHALEVREQLITRQAHAIARTAIQQQEPWTRHLGTAPAEPDLRHLWLEAAITIAVHRHRHQITSDQPVPGIEDGSGTGPGDVYRARQALLRARQLARRPSLASRSQGTPTRRMTTARSL